MIDPVEGSVLQQLILEPVFEGLPLTVIMYVFDKFEQGYLETWMIDDQFFSWKLIGLDSKGAFFCHRPRDTVEASGDPQDVFIQEEDHEKDDDDEHDEL